MKVNTLRAIEENPNSSYAQIGKMLGISRQAVSKMALRNGVSRGHTPTLKHSGGRRSPEYQAYVCAKARCNNPNHLNFPLYGGRGIEFRFSSFEQFIEHAGFRPRENQPSGKSVYSIDRINNDGHYELGNVKWSTQKEQTAPGKRRI